MAQVQKIHTDAPAADHANVHVALAAAQAEMAAPKKGAVNPHFKKSYADLADVVAAAAPLAWHGISYHHAFGTADGERYCETILTHGASGTSISSGPVPLIVGKSDMQGFKSATTYAKRIGLESVTGLAPDDDDDGNAAAANPPPCREEPPKPPEPSAHLLHSAVNYLKAAKTLEDLRDVWASLSKPVQAHADAQAAKDARKAELTTPPADDLGGDEIPYGGPND